VNFSLFPLPPALPRRLTLQLAERRDVHQILNLIILGHKTSKATRAQEFDPIGLNRIKV
jgi:hypothetical protein